MALKFLAVSGLTLTPQGIVTPGVGVLIITSVPSLTVMAVGAGVYKTPLTFTLAGGNAVGYDPGTVVTVPSGAIPATSLKALADTLSVMRVDDQVAAVPMTGTISGTPTPFVEAWKITNAGQTKVRAE
jgi:hypothetical protein